METYRNEVTAVRFAGGGSSYNQSFMSHRLPNLESRIWENEGLLLHTPVNTKRLILFQDFVDDLRVQNLGQVLPDELELALFGLRRGHGDYGCDAMRCDAARDTGGDRCRLWYGMGRCVSNNPVRGIFPCAQTFSEGS